MGREAAAMSTSPAQSFSKPVSVPEAPIATFTSLWLCWNVSASARESGNTVADPSIVMSPVETPRAGGAAASSLRQVAVRTLARNRPTRTRTTESENSAEDHEQSTGQQNRHRHGQRPGDRQVADRRQLNARP